MQARICHAEIDIRFSVRLNVEGCRALCERQLRPVAGNRVLILKCGLGKQIFHLGKSAAVIRCGYRHGLGFSKNRPKVMVFIKELNLFVLIVISAAGGVIPATPKTVTTISLVTDDTV